MKVLVTGGGGFLGGAVVDQLQDAGHEVGSASRGDYPDLALRGVTTHSVDLADAPALDSIVGDYEAVIHVAALAGIWGPREDFVRTNVVGTRNLLEACLKHGLRRFVYTSSPSAVFDGRDHKNASNDLPYPKRFLANYAETKAQAERLVLRANGEALATVALRPHLIFGPGDPHLVPRLVERGRAGRLAIVGEGDNEVSLTFVENAAAAHLDALGALEIGARCSGRAYFICQEEPVKLWEWIAELFEALDVPPVRRRISLRAAYAAGAACEFLWNTLRMRSEPPMTRFVARQLATSHSYDLAPARDDFGYRERVPLAEATERLVAWMRERESAAVLA